MKRIINIAFILVLLTAPSCNLLDMETKNNIETKTFYKNSNDISLAIIGSYGSLASFYQTNYVHIAELPSDNAQTGGESSDLAHLDKFSFTPVNSILSSEWRTAYRCIANVNEIISAMPDAEFGSIDKYNQFMGEALFIRALSYFNLVRIFGDLPMINEPISLDDARNIGRTSADKIYSDLIIPDLTAAAELLPDSYSGEDIGRASKWTAKSLLGKVYLTIHDYANAETVLAEVIASNKYSLLNNFADIFNPDNANHAESIFEIGFEKSRTGGSAWSCAAHNQSLAEEFGISCFSSTMPTKSIREAMDPASARYAASIGRGKNNGPYYIKKHYMELSIQNHSDDNWPLLRYADVLLMYAEASNEVTETPSELAIQAVNQIRRRAYGLDIAAVSEHDLSEAEIIDKDVFRHVIWDERRIELAFEGHRWFDLVRTDEYAKVMNQHFDDDFNGLYFVEDYNNLFPIPQHELDVNPNLAPNNQGYF